MSERIKDYRITTRPPSINDREQRPPSGVGIKELKGPPQVRGNPLKGIEYDIDESVTIGGYDPRSG